MNLTHTPTGLLLLGRVMLHNLTKNILTKLVQADKVS